MNTLAQLRTSIVRQVFADSQPDNLVDSHKQIVLEALSDIQKFVPCEKTRNANVIKFCNTWYKCGTTIVPRPRGVIKFLYTIENQDWCCPVFFRQVGRNEFECFANQQICPESETTDATVPIMPLGFHRANESTDGERGRATYGVWCIDADNILISPWILSTESVVMEWSGAKGASQWTDEDPLSDAIDFRKTVKLYLHKYGHERDYGDMAVALTYHNREKTGTYDEALSDLIWECHEQTRIRADDSCCMPLWCKPSDEILRALENGEFRGLESAGFRAMEGVS